MSVLQAATRREDQLVALNRALLDHLREFRFALITAVVTGHIDVAEWDNLGTTDRRLDEIEAQMASAAPLELKQARA